MAKGLHFVILIFFFDINALECFSQVHHSYPDMGYIRAQHDPIFRNAIQHRSWGTVLPSSISSIIEGVKYYVTEGAICSGKFLPLLAPRLEQINSTLEFLDCMGGFKKVEIPNSEHFDQGLIISWNRHLQNTTDQHAIGVFPLITDLASDIFSYRWRNAENRLLNGDFIILSTPSDECAVKIEYITLPALKMSAFAAVFYAKDSDSRSCGLFSKTGHQAAVITPVPFKNQIKQTLRLLTSHEKYALIVDEFVNFFAEVLKFSSIRVIFLEAELFESLNISPSTVDLFTSLFENGIKVVVVSFNCHKAPRQQNLSVIKERGVQILTGVCGTCNRALLQTIWNNFVVEVFVEGKRRWFGAIAHYAGVIHNISLISMVVDGSYVDIRMGNKTYSNFGTFPIDFVQRNWKQVVQANPSAPRESSQDYPLLEEEVLIIYSTHAPAPGSCKKCNVFRQEGRRLFPLDLIFVR